jgi:hypothetical protein
LFDALFKVLADAGTVNSAIEHSSIPVILKSITGVLFVESSPMPQCSIESPDQRRLWRYNDENAAADTRPRALMNCVRSTPPPARFFCDGRFAHEARQQMHGWLIAVIFADDDNRRNCKYRNREFRFDT